MASWMGGGPHGNRSWRVGYFAGPDSLVVFPDVVVVRQSIVRVQEAAAPLQQWLQAAIQSGS